MIETHMLAVVGAARIAYSRTTPVAPSEPPQRVLLLHGLGADRQGLLPLVRDWAGTDVIALDLPGFGRSRLLGGEHSLINYAHVLEALCAEVDLSDLIVIGHSLGASIGLAFAALHPHRIRSLVLICPVTAGQGPLSWLASAYYRIGSMLPRAAARVWLTSKLATYLADRAAFHTTDPDIRRHILAEDYRTAALAEPHAIGEIYLSLRRTPFASLAAAVRAPTLLIAADEDPLAGLQSVEALHGHIRDSRLTVIRDAGHLWPVEEPEAASRLIAESLHALLAAP